MYGIGRLALPDVWEMSGVPPGCPEVVWMPSRMSRSGRENLPNVPEWWETLLHVWQLSGGTLEIREALPDVR